MPTRTATAPRIHSPARARTIPGDFQPRRGRRSSTDRTDLNWREPRCGQFDLANRNSRPGDISLRVSTGTTSSQGLACSGLQGLSPGGSVTLTVNLADGVKTTTWYNYGPTPDDPTEHWYEFLFDGTTGAEFLADRILLHFVDGGRGDHDLTENGVIEIFGGPSAIADLYFPFFQPDSTTFVGVAVSNFSETLANLNFRAMGASGADLALPQNPASRLLEPETQLASLASELFGARILYQPLRMDRSRYR